MKMLLKANKTKHIILVMILVFLPKSSLFSQTILLNPTEKYWGISLGMNSSIVNFNPRVDIDYVNLGYNGGITYRYINENHYGIQVEFNYVQKGWKEASNGYMRQINYLEFPLLSHFYFGNTSRFFINIGPKFGYMINEKTVVNSNLESTAYQHITNVEQKFDYGASLGFGANINTHAVGIYELEVRGYYGLGSIFADTSNDYFQYSNFITAEVKLGWYIPLSGKKQ